MGAVVLHLAVLAIALLNPQEKNEAEELFKKMEEKLLQAKTLQCKVEGVVEPIKLKLAGALWFGEDNRVRLELDGRSEEATRSGTVISDGQGMRIAASDTARSIAAPDNIGRAMRLWFARAGLLSSFDAAGAPVTEFVDEFAASGFKLGAKEKVGDREAQAVEFVIKVSPRTLREDPAVVVWIDLKTHLPLKRTVTTKGSSFNMGETTVVREIYSDFKLDGNIDPAKFELSKEKK